MRETRPENLSSANARGEVRCGGGLLRANTKAYLDGELSAVRTWLVKLHVTRCPDCREELRWLRRLGEDMKDIESARPRPELRARILASLPASPPAPGIRIVHSRPDSLHASRSAGRPALAGSFAMLLTFSLVFALKRIPGSAIGQAATGLPTRLAPPNADAKGDAEAAVMASVTYAPEEDPYNAIADRLFHESMSGLEREKRIQGEDDLHHLISQARAAAHAPAGAPPVEMGVALAVPNIAAVRAHLPGWARGEGARLVASNDRSNGQAAPGADTGEAALHSVFSFSVRAERGAAFLGALNKLGQVSAMPAAFGAARVAKLALPMQGELTAEGSQKAVPTAPTAVEPASGSARAIASAEKQAKAARMIVLTVVLEEASRHRAR